MILTFKYPVYPTQAQEQKLMLWFDHLCELQNSARNNRKHAYETEKRTVTQFEQQNLLTTARAKFDDFRAVPQAFQVSALKRVEKAFRAFYQRCQAGAAEKGYPRYKKRVRSLTWCLRKHKRKTGERIRENPILETAFRHNRLKVPKLGHVKIRMHRPLQGDPKEVTLVKKASGWYAHISDAAWSTFFEWCGNIAARDGFHFHQVDPKNTSQTCSCCGEKSPKKLSLAIRAFNCQFCGTSLDRDHNAALNRLSRAAAVLRGERWVTTLKETRNNPNKAFGFKNPKQLSLFDGFRTGFPHALAGGS